MIRKIVFLQTKDAIVNNKIGLILSILILFFYFPCIFRLCEFEWHDMPKHKETKFWTHQSNFFFHICSVSKIFIRWLPSTVGHDWVYVWCLCCCWQLCPVLKPFIPECDKHLSPLEFSPHAETPTEKSLNNMMRLRRHTSKKHGFGKIIPLATQSWTDGDIGRLWLLWCYKVNQLFLCLFKNFIWFVLNLCYIVIDTYFTNQIELFINFNTILLQKLLKIDEKCCTSKQNGMWNNFNKVIKTNSVLIHQVEKN